MGVVLRCWHVSTAPFEVDDADLLHLQVVHEVSGVLAPFAVDQAVDLCSCGHENDDSAAGLVCMSWTATGTRTTATWNA